MAVGPDTVMDDEDEDGAKANQNNKRQGKQGTNLAPAKGADPSMSTTRRDINLPNPDTIEPTTRTRIRTDRERLHPVTSYSCGSTALREALLGDRFLDSRKYSRSRKGETPIGPSEVGS